MPKISRPSPALVVATIALFGAAGGGAWAATDHPSSGAHRASAAASHSLRGPRGPRGPRGFTGKTGPQGPSDGFVVNVPQAQSLTPGDDTVVAQLTLPASGSFVVSASTSLGNATTNPNPVSCTLLQNANPIGEAAADLPGQTLFAATATIPAAVSASDGTNIKLTCNPDSGANVRGTVITAVQVGTLHVETQTTP